MKYAFAFVRRSEITTFSINQQNVALASQTNPRGQIPGDVKAVSRILLSRRTSTIDLRNLPSSIGRVALKHWFTWSCSPKGFPEPCGHPTRWWALTPPSHPCLCPKAIGGLNLCGTFCHIPLDAPSLSRSVVPCVVRTFLPTNEAAGATV